MKRNQIAESFRSEGDGKKTALFSQFEGARGSILSEAYKEPLPRFLNVPTIEPH
jgi:hypothetical protein